jgi:hypothetical protein
MTELEIHIPGIDDPDHVIARVESVLTHHGLSLRSKGTLRSYPGCIH